MHVWPFSASKTDAGVRILANNFLIVTVAFRAETSRIGEFLRGHRPPPSETAPDISIEDPKRQLPREAYCGLPGQPESSAELQEPKSKVCLGAEDRSACLNRRRNRTAQRGLFELPFFAAPGLPRARGAARWRGGWHLDHHDWG